MRRSNVAALIALVLLLCSTSAFAQQAKPTPTDTPTKLETFQAKTGAVIIKGYTRIGTVRGTGGSATVISMEFTDAQTGRKEQGIVIEVKESDRLARENRSFIDADEIDSLLKGIEYISKIGSTVTKLASFEAIYRTKGEFSITTFSDSSGSISAAISSGRIGRSDMFIPLSELAAFKGLIIEAQAKLAAAR
jgi:hypothetical protein